MVEKTLKVQKHEILPLLQWNLQKILKLIHGIFTQVLYPLILTKMEMFHNKYSKVI